eukprot:6950620-Prymnesium_polylepis.1
MRRARDWVCGECTAINLGDRFDCFSCGAEKSANARAVARQVTDVEDAGPPPSLAAASVTDLHVASSEAASDVETTRPAAYYAAAARKAGGFRPDSFRLAALNGALTDAARSSGQRERRPTSGRANGDQRRGRGVG